MLLLPAGADPDAATTDGTVPLHMAAASGHDDAAWALLAAGANLNAAGGEAAQLRSGTCSIFA